MYPFFRTLNAVWRARNAAPLDLLDSETIAMRCWPIDIDMFMELNNGRTLTLYDIGRSSLASRTGLLQLLRDNGWGLAVAGASVRFRKRVRPFQKFEMRTRVLGWDVRFVYLEQSIWRGDTCHSNLLIRTAIVDKGGAVPTRDILAAFGTPDRDTPALPDWVQAWIAGEAQRPWPPAL